MSHQPQNDLDQRIDSLAAATAALPGEFSTDVRSAEALARIADRWRGTQAPVVVAGEVSTGKSQLINALIGEPLLTTDFKACTSSWVRLHHAPAFRATARVKVEDGTELRDITRNDLPTYLTVDGEKKLRKLFGASARVESVTIGLPSPLLVSGLELLDTPGAGGLQAAHRHTALAGLAQADAVLFVTRPGEPISASERLFLAEAVERVAVCVIVFTHRDTVSQPDEAVLADVAILTNDQQWESLLGDAVAAGSLARRFAGVTAVSVSSHNRLQALALGSGAARDARERVSNMSLLEEILRHDVVDRIGVIHRLNVVRLCGLLAADVARNAQRRRDLSSGDSAAQRELQEQDERLRRWTEGGGDHWRKDFENYCNTAYTEFQELARRRSDELNREYRGHFSEMNVGQIEAAVEEIGNAPQNLLTDLVRQGRGTIEEAAERVRTLLAQDGLDDPLEALARAKLIEDRIQLDPADSTVSVGMGELKAALAGGMVGYGATSLATIGLANAGWIAPAAIPIMWPFALGAALFGGYQWWQRRRRRTAQHATEYLDTVRVHLTDTVVKEASSAFTSAAETVRDEILAALADAQRTVTADRQAFKQASELAADPEKRRVVLKELTVVVERAETLYQQAEVLTAELR